MELCVEGICHHRSELYSISHPEGHSNETSTTNLLQAAMSRRHKYLGFHISLPHAVILSQLILFFVRQINQLDFYSPLVL